MNIQRPRPLNADPTVRSSAPIQTPRVLDGALSGRSWPGEWEALTLSWRSLARPAASVQP